jgi:hypothetical protein
MRTLLRRGRQGRGVWVEGGAAWTAGAPPGGGGTCAAPRQLSPSLHGRGACSCQRQFGLLSQAALECRCTLGLAASPVRPLAPPPLRLPPPTPSSSCPARPLKADAANPTCSQALQLIVTTRTSREADSTSLRHWPGGCACRWGKVPGAQPYRASQKRTTMHAASLHAVPSLPKTDPGSSATAHPSSPNIIRPHSSLPPSWATYTLQAASHHPPSGAAPHGGAAESASLLSAIVVG